MSECNEAMSLERVRTYVDDVAEGLEALGVPVVDHWVQEDDGRYEGLVELTGDDEEGALAFGWNSEDGWTRLWRHGPLAPGAFSRYSNVEDAAPVDDPVREIVRVIATAAGADPDQKSLF